MNSRDQKLQQITDWASRNDQVRVELLLSLIFIICKIIVNNEIVIPKFTLGGNIPG